MSRTWPLPIDRPPARNRSLAPPAKRTHEFASCDASVSRDLFRDAQRGVPGGWSSC
jgi:hypothetical protein